MGEKRRKIYQRVRLSALLLLIVMMLAMINSCGGVEGKEPLLEGVFVDGPVSGLNFKTESRSGQTDYNGVFKFKDGENITFSIGNIVLGTTKANSSISSLDLVAGAQDVDDPRVTNITILLQSLDFDGYLNNGIQIPLGIDPVIKRSIQLNGPLNFSQEPKLFVQERGLMGLLEELNIVQKFAENIAGSLRQPVPVEAAKNHLKARFSQRKVAVTAYGKVKGFSLDDNVWTWLGIPYARPPLGDLRWRAPQSPDRWPGFLDTTAHCLPCTQQIHSSSWQPSPYYMGSEDCLYLDIYRPKNDYTNLPVYVWIHGGINNSGAARNISGAKLAKTGNMVVVVIQYRLGIMGWFTHPALRETNDGRDNSGNYGMLDHIKGLEWIRENIAAFGGNPDNITVGGQSGGGHDVLNLITSPLTAGLFHKSVIESAALDYRKLDEGDSDANSIIDWLLVDDETAEDKDTASEIRSNMTNEKVKNYLRSKASTKIIEACRIGIGDGMIPASPAFLDGVVLPKSGLFDTISAGRYNKVPILIGSNEYEFKNLMPLYGELLNSRYPSVPSGKYTWGNLYFVLDGNLPLDGVFPTKRDKEFYHAVGRLKSRLWKARYVDSIARAFKANDVRLPVYAYRFDWSGGGDTALTDFDFILGSSCAMEIPFFFGLDRDLLGYSFTSSNEKGRKELQSAMMTYLANFVADGDPNPTDSPLLKWPQWSNTKGDPKIIIFDAGLTNLELSLGSEEESVRSVFADVRKERKKFNSTSELGYMDSLGLAIP